MKIRSLLLIMVFIPLLVLGQTKKIYDLDFSDNSKEGTLAKSSFIDYKTLSNDKIEISLLEGGFFTFGTNKGLSSSIFDDNCELTYGHPFALTSYPILIIDGEAKKVEELFAGVQPQFYQSIDTLKITYRIESQIEYSLIFEIKNEVMIDVNSEVKNLDNTAHTYSHQIIYDAALGKYGDGFVYLNSDYLLNPTKLNEGEIPFELFLHEKNIAQKGIANKIILNTDITNSIEFNNWFTLSGEAELEIDDSFPMFDLAIKLASKEQTLQPEEISEFNFSIKLAESSFPETAILRWDLQPFLLLSNNLVFPENFKSFALPQSSIDSYTNELQLEVQTESILLTNIISNNFYLSPQETGFIQINMNARTIYQDMVIPVNLKLKQNGSVIDEINKYMFIPGSPFSNEGLEVNIDSLILGELPKVHMSFNVKISETGGFVGKLYKENIFLYEEGNRILDFQLTKDTLAGTNEADIIFVLDVTGSMGDEIGEVVDNIIEFTDSLEFRGVDYQLGMVTFLDEIENVYDFTSDPEQFKGFVSAQYAHGGGDYSENSLLALDRAAQFNFRESSNRIVIWITDASYHINDGYYTNLTIQDVVNSMLSLGVTVHCIGNPTEQTSFYNPIVDPTGGSYFDIYGNFRDILLEISRLESSSQFLLTYNSISQLNNDVSGKLEIHYAGLGGSSDFILNENKSNSSPKLNNELALSCYPNPFNPVTNIQVNKPINSFGNVTIYNILGEKIKTFDVAVGSEKLNLSWNASNDYNMPISTGFYIVNVRLYDEEGNLSLNQSQKLLYLK